MKSIKEIIQEEILKQNNSNLILTEIEKELNILVNESTNLTEEIYHFYYPQHRGELTLDKVIKRIKGTSSLSTKSDLFTTIYATAYKELKKFSSAEEIMDNIYWHGTGGYVSKGLQAGFNIVKKGNEGGGGYGEQYHSISLSKNKNKASNFTGMSRFGMVYPVLLRKGSTVLEMPHINDANEIEDILVDMWLRKIDAVKIGNWLSDSSEEELVVLNPKAILKFDGEGYQVYEKKKFNNPDLSTYQAIFNTIQNNNLESNKDHIKVQYPESSDEINNLNESGLYDFQKIPIDITEENYNEALELRKKYSLFKDIGVATFLTTTILWRAIDENEYQIILKTKKLSGGNFAIPAEKYFGASFSGSREDALLFGKKWKKVDRLKGQLYLIGINAQDKEFLNLAMAERLKKQGIDYKIGDVVINSELGDHGIGFSVRNVTLDDVRFIYKINEENNTFDDITYEVIDETYNLPDDSEHSPLPDFGSRIKNI